MTFSRFWNSSLALIALMFAASSYAQVNVTKGEAITVSLSPLSGSNGSAATEILKNDLNRSGYLKVASGGDYTIKGEAGSSVQCTITKKDGSSVGSADGSGDLRQAVHRVADEIVSKITGKKGIAQSHIAFISDKSGKKELYAMDYDGFNVKRYTTDNSNVLSPYFSKQGDRIAFTSARSYYPDVYTIGFPSGGRDAVAKFGGLNSGGAFSPDGSKIAVTLSKDGNPELYTMSSGGGSPKRLTTTKGGESSPTWSPDGSQIAYCSDEGGRPQIYIISSSGGLGTRLTSSPSYNSEPDWSPDGTQIAYSSLAGSWAISVIDPKGGGGKVIYSGGNCEHPSWAPNGRHLVFSKSSGGRSDLYILDTVTKTAIQLSRDFGNCTQPSWSGR